MASNKKSGTAFERGLAQWLSANRWWVHLLTQNDAGQPADIIAAKGGKTVIIDCKVCEKGFFRLDRVEDNQCNAMRRWAECGNGSGWFALKLPDGRIRFFTLETLESKEAFSSILPRDEIEKGYTPERWLALWT